MKSFISFSQIFSLFLFLPLSPSHSRENFSHLLHTLYLSIKCEWTEKGIPAIATAMSKIRRRKAQQKEANIGSTYTINAAHTCKDLVFTSPLMSPHSIPFNFLCPLSANESISFMKIRIC